MDNNVLAVKEVLGPVMPLESPPVTLTDVRFQLEHSLTMDNNALAEMEVLGAANVPLSLIVM